MKTRLAQQFLFAVALAATSLFIGCAQQNTTKTHTHVIPNSPPPPPVVTQVIPGETTAATAVVPPSNHPEPTAPTPSAAPPLIISNPPPVAAAGAALPANLRVSKPLSEVIQLTQSGVDETVVLLYITNTTAFFTLGAEEIVYLNDLGVSGNVITAMMERDRTLKTAWATAAATPVVSNATVEPVAAAPTYVNPPQVVPIAAPEPQPVYVSNDYFYDSLSPYGTWVEIDGYGRCWRPTVAITSPTWQPYCDRGRWVHTDSGWYWMSDYSWGSVAFHYGRWFSHPRWGWCWWPDNVWAPSWVTWRYDNDNCGWAPLPPRTYCRPGGGFTYYDQVVDNNFSFGLSVGFYTFVPWARFCDPNPYRYCLPRPRSVAIYNQTTIINNVVIGNNNTVINRGISTDRVREHTRAEVRTVSLREENVQGRSLRQDHFERDGRTLVVRRPQLPADVRSAGRTPETMLANPKPASSNGRQEFGNRPERQENRTGGWANENRNNGRSATPTPIAPATATVIKTPTSSVSTVAPAAVRPESSQPERRSRSEETSTPRNQSRGTVVRLPDAPAPATTPAPTPATTATPIFSKPVVIQTTPQFPARPVQPTVNQPATVIGGNRSAIQNGRDYKVMNTPTPQPTPTVNAPSYNNLPGRDRSAIEQARQMPDNPSSQPTPNYNRSAIEASRAATTRSSDAGTRALQNRSEVRVVAPSYTPPAPQISAPVITPAPVMTPAPRPNFAPAPTPSAPKVESQPAPSRSESRSESKSDSGRSPRSR